MKHATRMAMTWHAMKNPDKRGVQRHHGSDPAVMPATSAPVKLLNVSNTNTDKNDTLLFLDCSSLPPVSYTWTEA